MKKEIKQKLVFDACRSVSKWSNNAYTWGDIKKEFARVNFELLDSDKLKIYLDEGFEDEDNSREPFYEVKVYRDVEETDEEFEKRKEGYRLWKIEQDKKDYKDYLKLKERFEKPLGQI